MQDVTQFSTSASPSLLLQWLTVGLSEHIDAVRREDLNPLPFETAYRLFPEAFRILRSSSHW